MRSGIWFGLWDIGQNFVAPELLVGWVTEMRVDTKGKRKGSDGAWFVTCMVDIADCC